MKFAVFFPELGPLGEFPDQAFFIIFHLFSEARLLCSQASAEKGHWKAQNYDSVPRMQNKHIIAVVAGVGGD